MPSPQSTQVDSSSVNGSSEKRTRVTSWKKAKPALPNELVASDIIQSAQQWRRSTVAKYRCALPNRATWHPPCWEFSLHRRNVDVQQGRELRASRVGQLSVVLGLTLVDLRLESTT